MIALRTRVCLVALTLAACGGERVSGTEPWSRVPEIRLAVLITESGPQLELLDEDDPFDASVPAGESAELWMFSYSAATLRAAYPGLAGASVAEIRSRLSPVLTTDGEVPPPADEIILAPIDGAAPAPLAYALRSWTNWLERGPAFRFQVPLEAVCGQITSSTTAAPADTQLTGLVAIGGERALVTGRSRSAPDGPVLLFLYDDGALRPLAARTEPAPASGRPSWDPASRTAWDIDGDGRLFRYDVEGNAVAVPPLPSDPDLGTRTRAVSAGRDGTVMATIDYYIVEQGARRLTQTLFEVENGGWDFARVKDGGFGLVDVVRADRLIAYYRCWVYQFRDPNDSSGWKQSVLDAPCPTSANTDIRSIDLDEYGGVIAGDEGLVYLRDEELGAWVDSRAGLPRIDFRLGLALGEESRALVASNDGKVFFRRSGHWCPADTTLTFDRGSSAPEGRVGFLLPASGDRIVRVELP